MKTKIVCTLGPSVEKFNDFKALVNNGMSFARINTAHGSFEQYEVFLSHCKKFNVPVMFDLKGPDLRVKLNEPLSVKKKERVKFFKNEVPCFNYDVLKDFKKNDLVFFDNGLIKSVVRETNKDFVVLEFEEDAIILKNKGVNVPNRKLSVPNFSDKDFDVINFAKKHKVDFLALSFVRSKDDVLRLKKVFDGFIISKIECGDGLKNIREIVEISNAVMVARGDLAVEIGKEKVPFAQKNIINLCNELGKPCIVATQMLEGMTFEKEPTRAEVSDVANAVLDGADAVMLSGETAMGKHPGLVVKTMMSILSEANNNISPKFFQAKNDSEFLIGSAVSLFNSLNITKAICLTTSGYTARIFSRHKINKKIIAITRTQRVKDLLSLNWGVDSIVLSKSKTSSAKTLLLELKRLKLITASDKVVLLRNKQGKSKITNAIELYNIKDL